MYIILCVLGAIAIIILAVLIYWKATNQIYRYWEFVRSSKRKKAEPHKERICELNRKIRLIIEDNDRISNQEKEVNKIKRIKQGRRSRKDLSLNKRDQKSYYDDFINQYRLYKKYTDFCKSKKLVLSKDEEEFEKFILETIDLFHYNDLDWQLNKNRTAYYEMYNLMKTSGEQLYSIRQSSVETIDRVAEYVGVKYDEILRTESDIDAFFLN